MIILYGRNGIPMTEPDYRASSPAISICCFPDLSAIQNKEMEVSRTVAIEMEEVFESDYRVNYIKNQYHKRVDIENMKLF